MPEPANIPKLVALDVDGTLLDANHRVKRPGFGLPWGSRDRDS